MLRPLEGEGENGEIGGRGDEVCDGEGWSGRSERLAPSHLDAGVKEKHMSTCTCQQEKHMSTWSQNSRVAFDNVLQVGASAHLFLCLRTCACACACACTFACTCAFACACVFEIILIVWCVFAANSVPRF